MRLFFLLLLMMNIAFYVWHEPIVAWLKGGEPAEQRAAARSDAASSLVLLSEREARAAEPAPGPAPVPNPAPAPVVTPAPRQEPPAATPAPSVQAAFPPAAVAPARGAAPAPAALRCLEIGPYAEAGLAEAARARAARIGMTAALEKVEREMPAGFWLLTEARYDLAGAREVLRRMGEQGVDDIAIVSLDSGMAVSLGLYSRTSAMERRRRELVELGYPVEVRQRSETRQVQMLRLSSAGVAEQAVRELLADLTAAEPRLEWRDAECR
jgi:hypothetical protein